MVVSGFTCIGVTVEISLYRRCRDIFHIDVVVNARIKLLRRNTSRDDCRTPFLIYKRRDGRNVNKDDHRLPFFRDVSRDNSRYTTVEMSL